jgi:hypothetical protein
MTVPGAAPFKAMKLRYAGTCRICGGVLAAGQRAVYYRDLKQVECTGCFERSASAVSAPTEVPDVDDASAIFSAVSSAEAWPNELPAVPMAVPSADAQIEAGAAGASARREHARRVAKREERIRSAHPRIGGFLLAVTDEPQSTRAWERGAIGEEKLAKSLNTLTERGARVLHDRRIPGSRANIDHLVVGPAGVFVIDAKRYKGRPHLRVEGGILRARTETLMVGGRDCAKLVTGIHKQIDLVTAGLVAASVDLVPVRGMLCFIDADWPLFGGEFTTSAIAVLWPKKIAERIFAANALSSDQIASVHAALAAHFLPA